MEAPCSLHFIFPIYQAFSCCGKITSLTSTEHTVTLSSLTYSHSIHPTHTTSPPPPPPHLHTLLPTPSVTYYIHCQLPPFHTLPPTPPSDNIISALQCTLCILHIPPSHLPPSPPTPLVALSSIPLTLTLHTCILHNPPPPPPSHTMAPPVPYCLQFPFSTLHTPPPPPPKSPSVFCH